MGTKLQLALNPFTGTTSNNTFAVNQITDRGARRPLGRSIGHHSMDEVFDLESHKVESIKKTMLMHEDIFQLQVKELHRLYDRQMKLMCELKRQKEYKCSPLTMKDANISQFTMWQKQMQDDIRSDFPICGSTYDSGERSTSCSGESQRITKAFNLERVTEQYLERPNCHRPLLGMPMNTGRSDDEVDVELTLSIGGNKSRKRSSKERKICNLNLEGLGSDSSKMQLSSNSVLMKIDTRDEFCDNSPSFSNSSASQKQDQTAASNWHFQDLSLNKT